MSLDQFLGLSHEMKIFEALAINYDRSYTIDELQDLTDIDTGIIKYLLPKLEYNGLIEINCDQIKLANNEITRCLNSAVLANSFLIAQYPENVTECNFSEWKKQRC